MEPRPTSVEAPVFGTHVWRLAELDEKLCDGLKRIEKNAAQFAKHYCVPSSIPDAELRDKLGATTIQHVCVEMARMQVSYGRRLATLYCDAVDSIARSRLHLASLALRAFLELTGAHLYFEQRLRKFLVAGISTQEEMDKINELIRTALLGGRFDWKPFFVGGAAMEQLLAEYAKARDHLTEPPAEIKQKSPAAFVKELEKHVATQRPDQKGMVRAIYAMLSDICHPSRGGDLLFTEIPQEPGVQLQRAEPHDEVIRDFIQRIACPVLLDITEVTFGTLKSIHELGDSLTQGNRATGAVRRINPFKDKRS